MNLEAIYTLHSGLPREGPGSDIWTRTALRCLPALPHNPVVYDMGCGPGRQTLVLARELGCRIIAVDRHQPYLDQLNRLAHAAQLSARIETRCADMSRLELLPESVDLIWSEGAVYNLGFQAGLSLWATWLKPGGLMAVTELTWLTDHPPDRAAAFWKDVSPDLASQQVNEQRANQAGLTVLQCLTLPPDAWWDEYYTPLLKRIEQLRPDAAPELSEVLNEAQQEIDLFRCSENAYGYVFYLLRKPAPTIGDPSH